MNISTQLQFELDFTESEKEIARYILNNGEKVLSMSTKSLARATYTSPATIVRLFQKIGLAGYNDFKIKYSAELQSTLETTGDIDLNLPFEKSDTEEMIAHKLSNLHAEVISDTLKLLNFQDLHKVVHMCHQAEAIDLYGSGNSLYAGLSFQHKMTRIGKNVNLRIVEGEQIFLARSSSPAHLAIVISYSGETSSVLRCAQILKQRGTPIVAITSIGDNHLSHLSNLILYCESREKIFSKIAPFASLISFQYILDLLYSCFFAMHYDENLQNKISFDRSTDDRHPMNSPVNDEIT